MHVKGIVGVRNVCCPDFLLMKSIFKKNVSWSVKVPYYNYVANKPDGEGQIPYDLTFNWNIINRRKKQTKYNQRH